MDTERQTPKKPAPAEKVDGEVALAEICKGLKMEPRVARRILRNAKVKVDGERWTWKKNSPDVAKVTKLLKDSQIAK
jgi:hypothetical protein